MRRGNDAHLRGDRAASAFLRVMHGIARLQLLEAAIRHAVAMEIELRAGVGQDEPVIRVGNDLSDLAA